MILMILLCFVGNRELRVWSREGDVVSTSESLTGQGMTLDWRSVIAKTFCPFGTCKDIL